MTGKKKLPRNPKPKGMTTSPQLFVSGVDVSQFQNQIDWVKVRYSGLQFAYIKATEGVTITDTNFAVNRQNARAAGMICGAYHLFRPLDTVQAQVDNFVAAVGSIQSGELPPMLDIEVPDDWKNIAQAARMTCANLLSPERLIHVLEQERRARSCLPIEELDRAQSIWVRNERTRKALESQGFDGVRVKRLAVDGL